MPAEEPEINQDLKALDENALLGKHRAEVIVRHYNRISARLEYEPLIARLLLFFLLLVMATSTPSQEPIRILGVNAASFLIAAYWWIATSWLKRQQKALESTLFRDSSLRALLVEFRHSDWKQTRLRHMLRLEPLVWVFVIAFLSFVHYLVGTAGKT